MSSTEQIYTGNTMTRRHWIPNPEGRPLSPHSLAGIARELGLPYGHVKALSRKLGERMGRKPTRERYQIVRGKILRAKGLTAANTGGEGRVR